MPNYISAIKLPSGDVYQIKDSGALRLTGGQVTGPVNFGDSVYISDLNAGTLIVTGNAAFTNNIQANTINGVEVGPNPKFTDTGTVTSVAVAAASNSGITVSGSPIASAGTITIGLNLSNAINGLGEGSSPANRNDYAVVQYAGGGVSTVTYHRRKLSNVFAALNSTDITNALGGNKNANVVFAGPSSGTAATPSFRALVEADIPGLAWSKITSGNDDLKAIEALTGTTGFLKKTNTNTWSLDTQSYIPSNSNGNTQNLRRPLQMNGLGDNTLDSKINTLRANRLAFLPADQIIIEKTTDGGATWVDAEVPDATKIGLFSEVRASVSIPLLNGVKNINCGLRITITAMKYNVPEGTPEISKYNYWNSDHVVSTERYNQLKEMYFWVSSNTDTISVKVERATGKASTTWSTIFENENYGMTGWSGNDYIRFSQNVFGGSTSQTGRYWNYRLTFFTRGPGGSTTLSGTNSSSLQAISEIRGYGDTYWTAGNNYAANDHLYTFDRYKNATFPAQVTATQFNGQFNGNATSASSLTNKTLDSSTIDRTAGSFTFQGSAAPWAGTDWVGLQVDSGSDKFQIHALSSTTLQYRQNDSGGTNSNWSDWQSLLSSGNYTDYTVTKTGIGASGTWGINISGTAAVASEISAITSNDNASNSDVWRNVWISYSNNTKGRPAISSFLAYQTSTKTLKAPHFLAEHVSGGGDEFRVQYGSTVDMALMIGSGNKNHGIWDYKGGAAGTGQWMIVADEDGNVTVNGNATSATKATQDESGNNIKTNYASSLSVSGTTFTLKSKSGASLSTVNLTSDNIPSLNASKITDGILPVARGGTGETSFSAGYLLYTPTTGSIKSTKFMHLNYQAGTTSALGYEELILGNTKTEGTADNAFGRIGFYSAKTKGSYITAANTTNSSWYDHVLPASAGWLVTGGSYDRATGTGTGVGSDTIPVYISTAGRATVITKVDVAHGGTGTTSFTANSLIMSGANTTAALTTRAISTSITTNASTNIPTESAVKTYVDNQIATLQDTVQDGYVTIAGNAQQVTGRKTFSNLAGASFKPAEGSESCNISYNQSLRALVFSFAN